MIKYSEFVTVEEGAKMNIVEIGEMNKEQISKIMSKENIKDVRVIFNPARSSKTGKAYLDLVGKKSRVSVDVNDETGELGLVFRETTVRTLA